MGATGEGFFISVKIITRRFRAKPFYSVVLPDFLFAPIRVPIAPNGLRTSPSYAFSRTLPTCGLLVLSTKEETDSGLLPMRCKGDPVIEPDSLLQCNP